MRTAIIAARDLAERITGRDVHTGRTGSRWLPGLRELRPDLRLAFRGGGCDGERVTCSFDGCEFDP